MAPGDVDDWIRYHSEISYALTTERTALESALIPVSAYILVACVESYRRYPEIIEQIDAALPAEELGRAGHVLTTQIDPVHMWAVPNFPLVGRKVLMAAGLVDPADDARRLGTIFDFWARASGAYRFDDGTHQAADATGHATPYRAYVDEIVAACEPIADPEQRAAISRLNALLTSYLFLLWFDTRSGYQSRNRYDVSSALSRLIAARCRRRRPARTRRRSRRRMRGTAWPCRPRRTPGACRRRSGTRPTARDQKSKIVPSRRASSAGVDHPGRHEHLAPDQREVRHRPHVHGIDLRREPVPGAPELLGRRSPR